jgi:hypothetical protein
VANVANYLEQDLRGEWSKVDAEAIIQATAERTGYTDEALEEVFHAAEERGRHEAVEKELDGLLRDAAGGRQANRPALDVAQDLVAGLARLRGRTLKAPPVFSGDRLLEETRKTPPGRTSGWPSVDAMDVSFNAGELAILGARTGHGKTTVLVLDWSFPQAVPTQAIRARQAARITADFFNESYIGCVLGVAHADLPSGARRRAG